MQKITTAEAQMIVGGTCTKTVERVVYGWNNDWYCEETTTVTQVDKHGNVKQVLGSSSKIVDDSLCGGGN